MITLLLLSQITREEFLDFRRQTEIQLARIDERFNKIETEIQALNQRIDDLDKKLNKRMDDLITYLWIFMGFVTILIGFIIGFGLLAEQVKKKLNQKLK
jgi:hypothetical protein